MKKVHINFKKVRETMLKFGKLELLILSFSFHLENARKKNLMCFLSSKRHKYFIVLPAEIKIGKRNFWEYMEVLPVINHLQRTEDVPSSLIIMKQAVRVFHLFVKIV